MRNTLYTLSFVFLCLLYPGEGIPADFTVNPVRIFFDAGQRTTVLTVRNQSDENLTLHLSAYSWDQDREGKDTYAPTEDIIIFPKILSINEGQERIIRIGTKIDFGKSEKTFRVYLEEIPQTLKSPSQGAMLQTLMKVGVPIFFAPMDSSREGSVENIELTEGNLSLSVLNRGNVHFMIKNIMVEGFDRDEGFIFRKELGGWYLLNGRSRNFSTKIPEEICRKTAYLNIDVSADVLSVKESLHVLPEMCSP